MRLKAILFALAIGAYLISMVAPGPIPTWALSLLCLAIVIVTFRSSKPYVRFLGSLFLAIGLTMFIRYGSPPQEMFLGFGKMMNVLSLFALAPIVAIPIDLGKYAYRIREYVSSKISRASTFYGITSLMAYTLCSFMNLASLPMVYHMIRPSLEMYPIAMRERFASRAITHGYSMPVLWTPAAPILGVVVDMTGVRWGAILPIVFPLSLLGVVLDWLMGLWISKRRGSGNDPAMVAEAAAAREQAEHRDGGENKAGKVGRHPWEIIVGIVAFSALISWIEGSTQMGFLLLVTLVVVPFALVWAMLIGRGKDFIRESVKKLPDQLVKMQDQFFVYLSAGFMITAIQATGNGHIINQWLVDFQSVIGSNLFLLFIPLIPLAFAFAGLHPAVSLALVAESLDAKTLGIPVELTAIAMLAGAATAFMMGPYNVTAGMMANLIGRTPYQVSNWNAPFTAAYLVMIMIALLILKNLS